MPSNTRRQKSKHQKGGFLSILLVFFLILQAMIAPLHAAYADDYTDLFSEMEENDEALYDFPEVDMDEIIEQVQGDEPFEENVENQGKEEAPEEDSDTRQETEEEDESTDFEETEAEDNEPDEDYTESENEGPHDGPSNTDGKEDSEEENISSEPEVFRAKSSTELPEEEKQENIEESDTEVEKSRRILPEENDDGDSDDPVRSSDAGPEEMPRKIYWFHISAVDLAVTTVHHAEYAIRDKAGNTLDTLTLSADNGWQADYEHIGQENLELEVKETALYDSEGNNVKSRWESEPVSNEKESYQEHIGLNSLESFETGIYLIGFESNGTTYLLTSGEYTTSVVKRWTLKTCPSSLESVPAEAKWNITSWGSTQFGTKLTIMNEACSTKRGYLTTFDQGNYQIYAVIDTSDLKYSYSDNGYLKAAAGNAGFRYLKATVYEVNCVKADENPTQFRTYQWTIFKDTVRETSVNFIHTAIPPPVLNTSVIVTLLIGGNVGERDREFPFFVSVDGVVTWTFSLSHKGDYVLNEIPIDSVLKVSMEAPGYQIRASFNNGVENDDYLTVWSVPADGGTVAFQADCDTELNTGIRTLGSSYALALMAVFLGIALQPLIQSALNYFNSKGGKNLP